MVIACKFCNLSDVSGDKTNSQYISVYINNIKSRFLQCDCFFSCIPITEQASEK